MLVAALALLSAGSVTASHNGLHIACTDGACMQAYSQCVEPVTHGQIPDPGLANQIWHGCRQSFRECCRSCCK
jgi:hypothetical protein